jgi:hypothetical protein
MPLGDAGAEAWVARVGTIDRSRGSKCGGQGSANDIWNVDIRHTDPEADRSFRRVIQEPAEQGDS